MASNTPDVASILAANPYYLGPPGTSRNMPGFADAARQATAMQNPALAAAMEQGTAPPTPMKNGQDMSVGTGAKYDPALPVSETNNPYTPQTEVNAATVSRWKRVIDHPEEYGYFLRSIGIDSPPGAKYDLNRLAPQVKDFMTNLITRAAAGIGGGFEAFRGFFANQAKNLMIPPTTPPQQKPILDDDEAVYGGPGPGEGGTKYEPPTTPPQQQQPIFPTQLPGGGTKPIDPATNPTPQPEPSPNKMEMPAPPAPQGNGYRQIGLSMLNSAPTPGGTTSMASPSMRGAVRPESGSSGYRDAGSRLAARRTRDPFATRRR